MRNLVDSIFPPADREAVLAAVRAAEAETSVEFVPMVVGASDSYPKAELACALTIGLLGAVLLCLALGTRDMWLFLLSFGPCALAGFEAAKRLPGLKRLFVSPERARHETLQAAQAAFYTHGLANTRQRNALLLYISVFERLVFLLPDAGLADKLTPGRLQTASTALADGIRHRRPAPALAATLAALACELAPSYPPGADDANELKDLIVLKA